jgi:hypothetical protein
MGVDKIAAFYSDPVKVACDRHSFDKAFKLRSLTIDEGLPWRARRWGRFLGRLAIGTGRRLLGRTPEQMRARSVAAADVHVPGFGTDAAADAKVPANKHAA